MLAIIRAAEEHLLLLKTQTQTNSAQLLEAAAMRRQRILQLKREKDTQHKNNSMICGSDYRINYCKMTIHEGGART